MSPSARCARTALAGVLVLASAPRGLHAQQEWPGFRGANGAAVASIALDVSTLAPEVLWRVEIGSGYSGVAVADGRVLTMIEDNGQFMLALDADTGAELWRQRLAEAYPGHDGSWDGPIATPVVHDGVVVGLEPWGRLSALDVVDGEPMWSVHLADDLGAPPPIYGFGSSPTVVGDTLVVNAGGPAGTVIGFALRTGEQRWKVGTELAAAQRPGAGSEPAARRPETRPPRLAAPATRERPASHRGAMVETGLSFRNKSFKVNDL